MTETTTTKNYGEITIETGVARDKKSEKQEREHQKGGDNLDVAQAGSEFINPHTVDATGTIAKLYLKTVAAVVAESESGEADAPSESLEAPNPAIEDTETEPLDLSKLKIKTTRNLADNIENEPNTGRAHEQAELARIPYEDIITRLLEISKLQGIDANIEDIIKIINQKITNGSWEYKDDQHNSYETNVDAIITLYLTASCGIDRNGSMNKLTYKYDTNAFDVLQNIAWQQAMENDQVSIENYSKQFSPVLALFNQILANQQIVHDSDNTSSMGSNFLKDHNKKYETNNLDQYLKSINPSEQGGYENHSDKINELKQRFNSLPKNRENLKILLPHFEADDRIYDPVYDEEMAVLALDLIEQQIAYLERNAPKMLAHMGEIADERVGIQAKKSQKAADQEQEQEGQIKQKQPERERLQEALPELANKADQLKQHKEKLKTFMLAQQKTLGQRMKNFPNEKITKRTWTEVGRKENLATLLSGFSGQINTIKDALALELQKGETEINVDLELSQLKDLEAELNQKIQTREKSITKIKNKLFSIQSINQTIFDEYQKLLDGGKNAKDIKESLDTIITTSLQNSGIEISEQ